MRRMHLPAVILLAALLLASCAINDVKPDYTFKGDKPKGVMAVALTYHGSSMSFLLWKVRQVPTAGARPVGNPNTSNPTADGNSPIFVFGGSNQTDVTWPPPSGVAVPANRLAGRIAVVELNPGTYDLCRWEGRTIGYLLNSGVKPLRVRFTIEPNKVTYIGDVHMFWENPTYRVGVYDMRDRDLPLIK